MAHTFHLDPRDVLDERDRFRWAVLVAAHNLIVTEQNEANEKAQRSSAGQRVAGQRRR